MPQPEVDQASEEARRKSGRTPEQVDKERADQRVCKAAQGLIVLEEEQGHCSVLGGPRRSPRASSSWSLSLMDVTAAEILGTSLPTFAAPSSDQRIIHISLFLQM